MTDITLDSNNDLLLLDGQAYLIGTVENLVRQRVLNKLRTFTGTLFTNIDYGINANLVFAKGTQSLLDQDIKTLISNTKGVVKLVSYSSDVGLDRIYTTSFSYEIETGEIVGVINVPISGSTGEVTPTLGIWKDGVWDYSGIWDNEEIWGGAVLPPQVDNSFTVNGVYITNNGLYLTNRQEGVFPDNTLTYNQEYLTFNQQQLTFT